VDIFPTLTSLKRN